MSDPFGDHVSTPSRSALEFIEKQDRENQHKVDSSPIPQTHSRTKSEELDHMAGSTYQGAEICPSCGFKRESSVICPVSQLHHGTDLPASAVKPQEEPQKSGWHFFKTKEEKDIDGLKNEATSERKKIAEEEKNDFKPIERDVKAFEKAIKSALEGFAKMQKEFESDHQKGYDALKKEFKQGLDPIKKLLEADREQIKKEMKKKKKEEETQITS